MTPITPIGLHKGWLYQEYDAVDAISRRHLHKDRTWMRTRYNLNHPREDTESLVLGRVVHAGVLDPEALKREYYFTEEYSRATKEGKARWAADEQAAEGRLIVRGYEGMAMVAAVQAHAGAMKLLSGGDAELSVFWRQDEDLCKARIDYFANGVLVELKTVQAADARSLQRDMIKYGYHTQLAWYRLGLGQYAPVRGCALVAVEKTPPYSVAVYYVPNDDLEKAESHVLALLEEYRTCRAKQDWTGYPDTPQELRIPAWAWGNQEVVLDY